MVTQIGNQLSNIPLAFDTGSSGVALNALEVFPSTIVTPTGFILPAGAASITYSGITITNVARVRLYGGSQGTTEYGNLGFANIRFGDSRGQLSTATMPIFFYYSITETATGEPQEPQHKQGWFGVNSAADKVFAPFADQAAVSNLPCSLDSQADCYVVSPLKYVNYASSLHAGFMLQPSELQLCNIAIIGGCKPVPMLTIGLTSNLEASFSQVTLTCPQGDYNGPPLIEAYAVCQGQIPFTTVTVTPPEHAAQSFTESALFDSGNPAADVTDLNVTSLSTLPEGTLVEVMPPSGFVYSYIAESAGTTKTSLGDIETGFGINFFTSNSFFIDFVSNTEGWMAH